MSWHSCLNESLATFADADPYFGEMDCCQLVRDYWLRMTGEDKGAAFEYDDKAGADELLARHGGVSGILTEALGPANGGPAAGDLVVVSMGEDIEAAGIFNGSFVWTVHPTEGLWRVPAHRITEAWSCPAR